MEKMDIAKTGSFKDIFEYLRLDRNQNVETEISVVRDYVSGKGDPSRVVARIERATRKHRNMMKQLGIRK